MDNKEIERREYRRKRRIRNQIISYVVLLFILAGIGAGGYFGFIKVVKMLASYDEKVTQAIQEASNHTEDEVEEIVVETQIADQQTEQEVQSADVEEPAIDPLDELVDTLLADMTLEEKVAGLFIVTPESITGVGKATQAGNGTKKAIEDNPVGGIIYTSKNYLSNDQFKEMIINTNSYSKFPLFIAVDRECGKDTSFEITQTEPNSSLTDASQVRINYSLLAEGLRAVNFNMVLGPVADIVAEDGNSLLQGRTFGTDGETVAPLVGEAVNTIQQSLEAVVKTFPGEGSINSNNELTKSIEEIKNAELLSFKGAVDAKASAIMVSNLYVTNAVGEKIPACFSNEIISLIRDDLGYNGIVMTDYLNEKTITSGYKSSEAAVKAILAGADILLTPDKYSDAYNGLLSAVNDGTISEERINESLHRIYKVKYKNALDN